MQPGDTVYLRAYGGEVIARRVVMVGETYVAVCRDEEYESATREGRAPVMVGFPLTDMVEREIHSEAR